MRIILQRVSRAAVKVDGKTAGEIGRGVLLLVGIHREDTEQCADILAQKCAELRIFPDGEGKMNLSCQEVQGSALVVSQFTLYGDSQKGRRPNFMEAAGPEKAVSLFNYFVKRIGEMIVRVETGVFGAIMEVELVNDGPVTILLERRAK